MRIVTAGTAMVGVLTAVGLVVTGCSGHRVSGTSTTATSSGVAAPAPGGVPAPGPGSAPHPCTLPHFGDLIEWQRRPGKVDSALRFPDVDPTKCEPALDGWMEGMPPGPGVCFMIGWASDNPGYNVFAKPAPPLKNTLDKVGDAC